MLWAESFQRLSALPAARRPTAYSSEAKQGHSSKLPHLILCEVVAAWHRHQHLLDLLTGKALARQWRRRGVEAYLSGGTRQAKRVQRAPRSC